MCRTQFINFKENMLLRGKGKLYYQIAESMLLIGSANSQESTSSSALICISCSQHLSSAMNPLDRTVV